MTSGISTVRATDPSFHDCDALIEVIATFNRSQSKWSRRESNPNPATVRLLVSEQSNPNRGPKQWHLCNCQASESF
ncbi:MULTISPECIES: hypothetical protein [unclassified Nostoc]|uniref:hypothetical protein n=1 Tax=unclassified Nostoc TaxID=2593658 RepID=UPI0013CF9C09|nr:MULTISPECIES: hypothetical protein [unclassified Nostoc]MBE9001300.1 hypothetical protein [Nostoc sp. LEGE 12447]NEU80386.1 hypothetical protein [Nostoc sp. UIC 10630]